ncbi:Ni/Fe-hydrogenase subunit HybB-like protein [Thermodesulfitimonas autotrophica]|uniref:Ni/Fe-hydrogenase subunit HybB-like protein n=1 Tax=Thermodesulfitimonas autotrophica TaxID=1894989 RepID=A0A3N5AZC6_9THEO|nr:NrfD/PsrC family molybdoenzyme membrane anchor subunit [Thermodesulfitimonas autotrophica]RPF42528.1 Ni/Fe-hydrogenase subunit HybB-like protein [Thermodesulfitimonas autotrophica]
MAHVEHAEIEIYKEERPVKKESDFTDYDAVFGGKWSFAMSGYRVLAFALIGLMAFSMIYRLTQGLGPATNLNDQWPWGLWIAFDDLCGIALAAGGFFTVFVAHILNLKQYKYIARASLITAWFGYIVVALGVLMDLGRWYNFWRPFVSWGYHSWLFVVLLCVIGYQAVMTLQFGHIFFERVNAPRLKEIFDKILPVIFVAGLVIGFLHQSALGALYIAMIDRQNPLWWSMLIGLFFFLSAAFVGPAMCVVEGVLASKAYKKDFRHEVPLLAPLLKAAMWLMVIYLVLKVIDLVYRGHFLDMFDGSTPSNLFLLEMVIGVIIPIILLAKKHIRESVPGMVTAAVLIVIGVMLNRMNVVFTSMYQAMGGWYFPHWMEFSISIGLVSLLIMAYCFFVENFKIMPEEHEHH